MKLSNKTIQYSVYGKIDDAMKQLANLTSVQLPSIENLTDTIKGAGIMGEIDLPSLCQTGPMTFSLGFRTDDADAAVLSAPKVEEFEVRWVVDKLDTANISIGTDAHKAVIKGLSKKYDPGKVETGSAMEGSNEYEALYYKKFVNGVSVIEIDKLNNVFRVNGIDYAADIRAAL